jgi:phage gp29-like protein
MKHDPSTCPYCGDLKRPRDLDPIDAHIFAKLAEFEHRIQQMEWRTQPLGPNPDEEVEERNEALDKLVKEMRDKKVL